jgi:hypothetical protein
MRETEDVDADTMGREVADVTDTVAWEPLAQRTPQLLILWRPPVPWATVTTILLPALVLLPSVLPVQVARPTAPLVQLDIFVSDHPARVSSKMPL